MRAEIAYQVIGGTKFYERAEIKDAIAYLNALVNPQDVGRVHADRQLAAAGDRTDLALARARVRQHDGRHDLGGRRRARAGARPGRGRDQGAEPLHGHDARAARARRGRARRSPSCSRRPLRETGYLEALEAERTIEAQGRIENLEELVNVAAEYDAGDAEEHVAGRVPAAGRADRRRRRRATDDEGLVTLMTLHNAKGLEYPIVFIIGCEEGVFPHSRALDEGGLEEERRLCYVGITRAERDLYLTYARARDACSARAPSVRPAGSSPRYPLELTDREEQAAARGLGSLRARLTSWRRQRL